MGDHFTQTRTRMRQAADESGRVYEKGAPFLAQVIGAHNPHDETLKVDFFTGERDIRTLHPYVGADSWIRVAAETNTSVIMSQRPDSTEPEPLAYSFRNPDAKVDSYNKGSGLYRPLKPGEVEVHSNGAAQTFWSSRPRQESRGGLIRQWLDQDSLTAGVKAPVHKRQLHLHRSQSLGDEERFGVVERPKNKSSFKRQYVTASGRSPDVTLAARFASTAAANGITVTPGPFAKEYARIINTGALFPEKLVDLREGDVIDDDGKTLKLSSTGKPMRLKVEYFTESALGGVFFFGIDDQGNFALNLPDEAKTGGDISIPSGDLLLSIGKNYDITVQTNHNVTALDGAVTFKSKRDFSVTSDEGSMVFKPASQFNVGKADEAAVLGEVFLDFAGQIVDYLGSHQHIGNYGSLTPVQPTDITKAQKLKADFLTTRKIVSDYFNLSKAP